MHRIALLACLAIAGCGESPSPEPAGTDAVRRSARAYVEALRSQQWGRACGLMTAAAREELRDGSEGSCPHALAAGAALAPAELDAIRRQLAGARVRVRGGRATLGPLGDGELSLGLERRRARWLVAG